MMKHARLRVALVVCLMIMATAFASAGMAGDDAVYRHELNGRVNSVNGTGGYLQIDGKTFYFDQRLRVVADNAKLTDLSNMKDWIGRQVGYSYDQMGGKSYVRDVYIPGR